MQSIGIITHHWVPNFGANLQALATVSCLKAKGFDPVIIDYRPEELVSIYEKRIPLPQQEMHARFVREYLPLTEQQYGSLEEIKADPDLQNFYHVLAGSDALFRLKVELNREDLSFPNPFWLNWVSEATIAKDNTSFLSVSSMGTEFKKLPSQLLKGIETHLKSFSMISVRDGWTRDMVNHIARDVKVVETVDPVFLLNDYFEIPEEYQVSSKSDYVLLCPSKSDISSKWLANFQKEAHKHSLRVVGFPNPEGFPITEFVDEFVEYPISPLKWYSYLANARGYVGTRFHPVVTCLENGTPFVSLDQYHRHPFERGKSKTYDICRKMGMTDYCISKKMIPFYSPKTILKKLLDPNQGQYAAKIKAQKRYLEEYLDERLA